MAEDKRAEAARYLADDKEFCEKLAKDVFSQTKGWSENQEPDMIREAIRRAANL